MHVPRSHFLVHAVNQSVNKLLDGDFGSESQDDVITKLERLAKKRKQEETEQDMTNVER